MSHVLHHVVLAVTPSPSPSGSPSPAVVPIDPSKVEPGVLGLTFFVVMAIAVVLLAMSMRRHLGRVDVDRHEREKRGRAAPEGQPPPAP